MSGPFIHLNSKERKMQLPKDYRLLREMKRLNERYRKRDFDLTQDDNHLFSTSIPQLLHQEP